MFKSSAIATATSSSLRPLPASRIADEMVRQISPDIWTSCHTAAQKNNFHLDQPREEDKIKEVILTQMAVVEAKFHELSQCGYEVTDIKFSFSTKSIISGAEVAMAFTVNDSGIKLSVDKMSTNNGRLEYPITTETMTIVPEKIKEVISRIRDNNSPTELPPGLLNGIREQLHKEPNWTEANIVELGFEERTMPLLKSRIQSELILFRPASTKSLSSSTDSLEKLSVQDTLELGVQKVSFNTQRVSGVYAGSFFWKIAGRLDQTMPQSESEQPTFQ